MSTFKTVLITLAVIAGIVALAWVGSAIFTAISHL
jgi:hypothetical protein